MRSTQAFFASILVMAAFPTLADSITFDEMKADAAPAGFTVALTGSGGAATWIVKSAPGGASGRVVVQTSAVAIDNRFPLLIRDGVTVADLDLSVRFQAVSGKVDQAAGLVWRYQDANNYYLVRANALEDNVVAYKVEKGRRIDLPVKGQGRTYGATAPVSRTGWNTLSVAVRGDGFNVSLNGAKLYEVEDKTFPKAGRIGLWTKADSVMMFDDLNWTVIR